MLLGACFLVVVSLGAYLIPLVRSFFGLGLCVPGGWPGGSGWFGICYLMILGCGTSDFGVVLVMVVFLLGLFD